MSLKSEIKFFKEEIERNKYTLDSARESEDGFFSLSRQVQQDLEDQVRALRSENELLLSKIAPEDLHEQITQAFVATKSAEQKAANLSELNRALNFELDSTNDAFEQFKEQANTRIT